MNRAALDQAWRIALGVPLLLAAIAGAALAADDPAFAPAADAHRAGRWSMQFELGPEFLVSGFDGAGLAVTRNSSDTGAWRLGLSLRVRSVDSELSMTDPQTPRTSIDGPDRQNGFVNVDVLRLKRFHPDRRVGLELGLGPRVTYRHDKEDFTAPDTVGTIEQTNRLSSLFLGVAGRLGAEVLLARSVSVHAHYGVEAGYGHLTTTQEFSRTAVQNEVKISSDHWTFSPLGVLFGVSVYL